jgi:hypothetical protein
MYSEREKDIETEREGKKRGEEEDLLEHNIPTSSQVVVHS